MNTDEIFTEKIQKNREICDGCFRRIRDEEDLPDEENMKTSRQGAVTECVAEGEHGSLDWVPPRNDDRGQVTGPAHPQYVCDICGTIDAGNDPKTSSEMMRDGERICQRLKEQDIPIDEDVFFDTLRDLKEDPAWQFRDADILQESVARGVQAAKEADE